MGANQNNQFPLSYSTEGTGFQQDTSNVTLPPKDNLCEKVPELKINHRVKKPECEKVKVKPNCLAIISGFLGMELRNAEEHTVPFFLLSYKSLPAFLIHC